jgi:RNA polymerase sigma-70 factor (ECF subfamily)
MGYVSSSTVELIHACVQTGDAAAWEEFVRRFHKLIGTIVIRTARRWCEVSSHLVDDLVQETYLKLCAKNCKLLRSFHAGHPEAFYGFLKVVTANLVNDHFKALQTAKRGGASSSEPIDSVDVASPHTSGSYCVLNIGEQRILMKEIDTFLKSSEEGTNFARDRRIFWLYYRVGLTASAIAALPTIGLSTKGVESTLLRLTRHVRDGLTAKAVPGQASSAKATKGIQPAESL